MPTSRSMTQILNEVNGHSPFATIRRIYRTQTASPQVAGLRRLQTMAFAIRVVVAVAFMDTSLTRSQMRTSTKLTSNSKDASLVQDVVKNHSWVNAMSAGFASGYLSESADLALLNMHVSMVWQTLTVKQCPLFQRARCIPVLPSARSARLQAKDKSAQASNNLPNQNIDRAKN